MGDTLLGRVVRYLAEQPDADVASLLGYWAGQEGHETLVELADRPLVLKDEALGDEFDDAVDQCLSAVERANRRAFLGGAEGGRFGRGAGAVLAAEAEGRLSLKSLAQGACLRLVVAPSMRIYCRVFSRQRGASRFASAQQSQHAEVP